MKIVIISSLLSLSLLANIVGLSTHPFELDTKAITTEFDSYLSNGSGMGITAKYYQKLTQRLNIDAGVGITSGDRENRVFTGADYELFPDYGRQPRASLKGIIESISFDDQRLNNFLIAPTLAKGLAYNNQEIFPFLALPLGVSLNTDTNEFETTSALAAGLTTRFGVQGGRDIIANLEANVNLKNSYTALVLGVSLPLL